MLQTSLIRQGHGLRFLDAYYHLVTVTTWPRVRPIIAVPAGPHDPAKYTYIQYGSTDPQLTATTLQDGHNTAIGTPLDYPSPYNTEIRQTRGARDHIYNVPTPALPPAPAPIAPATTTTDLATWT